MRSDQHQSLSSPMKNKKMYAQELIDDIKTEVGFQLQLTAKQMNVFIVGFSVDLIPCKKKILRFLHGIGYSIYVAAFDLDDEDDMISETRSNATNESLDNKHFFPRPLNVAPLPSLTTLTAAGSIGQQMSEPHISRSQSQGYIEQNGISEHHHTHDDSDAPTMDVSIGRGRSGSNAVITEQLKRVPSKAHLNQSGHAHLAQSPSALRLQDTGSPVRQDSISSADVDLSNMAIATMDGDGTEPSSSPTRSSDSNIRAGSKSNEPYIITDQQALVRHQQQQQQQLGAPQGYVQSAPIGIQGDQRHLMVQHMQILKTKEAPTWDPVDWFSYPVEAIPSKILVADNMIMEHFVDITYIADGSNSNIFLAKLNDEKVIIKMIKEGIQMEPIAVHEFDVEHGMLSRINHPNIIKLIGAGKHPRRFIVLEWLGGGTLNTILSQNQMKSGLAQKLFRRPSFTYSNLLSRAKDMASALDFLHRDCHIGASIIHRDLKPDNVGFTSGGCLKLFDFGLCTCVKAITTAHDAYEMTGNTGSLRYMAPEVALKKPYNEKADVYSFGIMLWQMTRDRVPFKGMSRDEFMTSVVLAGDRPKLDKSWPRAFSSLLSACWSADYRKRPSFQQILAALEDMIAAANRPSWSTNMKESFGNSNNEVGHSSRSSKEGNADGDDKSGWFA